MTASKQNQSLRSLVFQVFLACIVSLVCVASSEAATGAASEGTFTGTLTQKADNSQPDQIGLTYSLVLNNKAGTTYGVNFNDPKSAVIGIKGENKPSAEFLKTNDGAEVEIAGLLKDKQLTALKTRVISANGGLGPAPLGPTHMSVTDKIKQFFNDWSMALFILVFIALIVVTVRMMPRTKTERVHSNSNGRIKNFIKYTILRRTRQQDVIGWDNVAGCEEAKAELMEVVEFLRNPKLFDKLGAKAPRGVLLNGPPGTGKTMLAKACAREAKAEFFGTTGSSFVQMFVGLGASRMRRLFKEARKQAPAIIFIDEIDGVGKKRGKDLSGEKDQTLNQLLAEMDGFGSTNNVVVIAATNLPEELDSALLRPGRFDRQIMVGAPDLEGRKQILKVHTKNKPVCMVDLNKVAKQTPGLTGADLANLCNEAAIFAGRAGRELIVQRDFTQAFERVVAGLKTGKLMTPEEKRVVAYHEAGHAVVAEILPNTEGPHKISIVPTGNALGFTMHLPEEDRYLQFEDELYDHIKVLLAGRCAEEFIIGRITTGASDDLRRASETSRAILEQFGMGEHLATDIGGAGPFGNGSPFSDSFRYSRDAEQNKILTEAKTEARRILEENRDVLDKIAEVLLEEESIDREQIDLLVKETLTARGNYEEIIKERTLSAREHTILNSPKRTKGIAAKEVTTSIPPPTA